MYQFDDVFAVTILFKTGKIIVAGYMHNAVSKDSHLIS